MTKGKLWRSAARWIKFNLVGAAGIGVQLGMLWLLTGLDVGYLLGTVLAVEAAVLHNFFWHERFTWADRSRRHGCDSVLRLLRFNLTAGAVSVGGNLLLMRLLVGGAHLQPVVANLISIVGCSAVNFLLSDCWVFGNSFRPVVVVTAGGTDARK